VLGQGAMSITASADRVGGQCSRLFRSAGHESSARRSRPALRTPTTRTTTPRLGGGVRTSFPKLAGCVRGMATSGVASMSSFRECCTAKYRLRTNDSSAYVVHRSNAAPGRAVCFLGRFLPKLGGAASAAFFVRSIAQPPHVGPEELAVRPAPSDQRSGRGHPPWPC
jgi:hypothetical protein